MRRCLALVLPSGTYGSITKANGSSPRPLTISSGTQNPPKLTLIVDETTEGAAQVFTLVLQSAGRAKVEGKLKNEAARVINVYRLPDGSGYTLVTGLYSTRNATGSGGKSK
jgi:C-terminal processing protease CtpA/Prc